VKKTFTNYKTSLRLLAAKQILRLISILIRLKLQGGESRYRTQNRWSLCDFSRDMTTYEKTIGPRSNCGNSERLGKNRESEMDTLQIRNLCGELAVYFQTDTGLVYLGRIECGVFVED
jgi:hypothetical protein